MNCGNCKYEFRDNGECDKCRPVYGSLWEPKFSTPPAPDPRDELLEKMGRALTLSTLMFDQMNRSGSHAASWVEPRSTSTTKRIAENNKALSAWQKFKEGK